MNTDIILLEANVDDAESLLNIQRLAFMILQHKYGESPAEHSIENIKAKIEQGDYYKIIYCNRLVGGIFVHSKYEPTTFNLHIIYILPELQGKGIAQEVIIKIENIYPNVKKWTLDTPITEYRNCYLYEKVGYKRTGKMEKVNDKLTLIYFEKQVAPFL